MRKILRSYLVFTSFFYKLVLFLVLPIGMMGVVFWAGVRTYETGLMFLALLWPMAEIISDSWLFGGLQTKDTVKLDCLKVSGNGRRVLRDALMLDLVRKFLSILIIQGIWLIGMEVMKQIAGDGTASFSIFTIKSEGIWFFAELAFVSYFCSVLGTFLSRYGSLLWISMMVGYGMMLLEVGCIMFAEAWGNRIIPALLFAVLGILVSILTVRTGISKLDQSFYDK